MNNSVFNLPTTGFWLTFFRLIYIWRMKMQDLIWNCIFIYCTKNMYIHILKKKNCQNRCVCVYIIFKKLIDIFLIRRVCVCMWVCDSKHTCLLGWLTNPCHRHLLRHICVCSRNHRAHLWFIRQWCWADISCSSGGESE